MSITAHTVLAGIDGSEQAARAALWAADDAERRRASLRLITAFEHRSERDLAEQLVREVAGRCRAAHPALHVTDEAVQGDPVEELLARPATAIVLGSRGRGALRGVLLGSVSAAVAAHADHPVVVVRGKIAEGPVVVGIGPTRTSPPAVRFAFAAAERHAADVVAVQAVPDAYLLPGLAGDPHRQDVQEQAEQRIAALLEECRAAHPDVPVRRITTDEHPVPALCEHATDARLAVVGRQRRSAARLGSTALGTLHHAPCPIAIVPHDEEL